MDIVKIELVEKFHRFDKLKHSTVNPKAFAEKRLVYACYHPQKSPSNPNDHFKELQIHMELLVK